MPPIPTNPDPHNNQPDGWSTYLNGLDPEERERAIEMIAKIEQNIRECRNLLNQAHDDDD